MNRIPAGFVIDLGGRFVAAFCGNRIADHMPNTQLAEHLRTALATASHREP